MNRLHRLLATLLVVTLSSNLFAASALAAGGSANLGAPDLSLSTGTEYVSGNYPGAILMPINLWGSVGKPGIHHVPTHTDLVTLLSLAGGPQQDAVMDNITIKRRSGAEEQVIHVNGDDLFNKPGVHSPVLEANDIVVIPREKPAISNNTLTALSFFGTVLSVILSGYAVSKLGK